MLARLAVAVVAVLVLAGCAGGGGGGTAEPDSLQAAIDDVEVEATATTGVIRGVVVDDAIRPLAGVNVTIEGPSGPRSTETTASGAFGFSLLDPGAYVVRAHLFGYTDAQQTVDVVAGDANPPATKLLLAIIPGLVAFVEQFKWEGYMQCGTNFVIACAGPNAGSQIACAMSKGEPPIGPPTPPSPVPVCLGNLTEDEFTIWHGVAVDSTLIQSEMVWESTQSLGDSLTMYLRYGDLDSFNAGFYNGSLNQSTGQTPLVAKATAADMNGTDLGTNNGYVVAIFPGESDAIPFPILGVTVSQLFTVFSFAFHGFLPPDDWTFTGTNTVPVPE